MKRNAMCLKREVILLVFLFFSIHFGAMAQNVTVSGTVTDDTGQPLPGVNVVVEGTATGTITDIEGNYSLTVPSDGVLVFNYIGFSPQSVSVDGRCPLDRYEALERI